MAQQTSRLLQLANEIQAQVSQIQRHLSDTGQPDPSFDGQSEPTDWTAVDDTRSAALENLTELRDLLATPHEMLSSIHGPDLLSRHFCDRFDVYQAVPLQGSITYEELARATKAPIKYLRRLIRHAATQRIFYEPAPGCVAHTQASRLMAENAHVRDYWGTICEEVWPAATKTVDAIQRWPEATLSSESGYQLAHGRTIYESLAADKVKQARYDSAMSSGGNDRTAGTGLIVENYDWAGLEDGTVVDVGGGVGTVMRALARAFPRLNFVVEDRPEVLVKATVEGETEDVRSRIRFLEHDFFTPQPVHDADVYFIRRVMMEWPDAQCVEMLRALKPALKPGAVVLIQDPYDPEFGSAPIWQERKMRASDLLVMTLHPVMPRQSDEWRTIFERAGAGFEFRGVKKVPQTDIGIAEAVWRGE